MAEIRCPQCGKINPKELEECQFCGSRIKPLLASTPVDSKPIQAGEHPILRDTSEFEKVKPLDEGPIHAGDVPIKRDTGELERALPTWLQSLRKGEDPAGETSPGTFPDGGLPAATGAEENADETSDWLSGLGKASSEEEEEVPDWLAGLRDAQLVPTEPESIPESNISSDDADWMKALGSELRSGAKEPGESVLGANVPAAQPTGNEEFTDWLQGLQGESPGTAQAPAPGGSDDLSSWLSGLPGETASQLEPVEPPSGTASSADLPDWLNQLEGKKAESEPAAASTPEWLSGLPDLSAESEIPAEAAPEPKPASSGLEPGANMPDWLSQIKEKATESEPASGSEPDWLSSSGSEPGTPVSAPGENVPEWLSNLEEKSGPGTGTPAAVFGGEIVDGGTPPGEVPDWLSQLQSDVNASREVEEHKDEFDVAAAPETKDAGALPDWLAGIDRTSAATSAVPALIVGDENNATDQEGEAAFSMETPDWLSTLKPEERQEKKVAGEEETAGESIEAAELPSWVQAMRPVEAVVSAEPKATPIEDNGGQFEQSGPLAGLQGVLPSTPGLGPLRKPPAYSIKLQVTENQRKYAAYLERLVMQETQAKGPGAARLVSSRVWRWAIFGLLFVVVLLSLATGFPSTPASLLNPSEINAAYAAVDQVLPDSAVLVVFDYDPALFGEMEAAAAPLMDHLLAKNPRLTFVSTSPTGPALAERFMLKTQGNQYKLGEQYADLGYLAGGPSGVLGFASNPRAVAGTAEDWQNVPLLNVDELSDFSLIVILTDNADTGRVWIEQTRAEIDNDTPTDYTDDTPILMAISAQAEPMLLPYYDSGQVQGIVTGLMGGKIYEQKNGQPALAAKYWNSFGAATFVAELLIIGGALWGAVTGWRARKKNTGEDA